MLGSSYQKQRQLERVGAIWPTAGFLTSFATANCNEICVRPIADLVQVISNHNTLHALSFSDCGLDDTSIDSEHSPTIFGDDPLSVIAAMLQANNSIRAVDLSLNKCSEKGCRSIATAIKAQVLAQASSMWNTYISQNAKRASESWIDSLRGRASDIDVLRGTTL